MKLKEFLDKYPANKKKDRNTMIYFGWCDWFCKDSELSTRLDKMYPVIKKATEILGIDVEMYNYYLKNVCIDDGNLYDRIGIIDIETDEQFFIINFPALEGTANRLDLHNSYTFFTSINDFYESIVDETDLSVFYENILINKNEILLPVTIENQAKPKRFYLKDL